MLGGLLAGALAGAEVEEAEEAAGAELEAAGLLDLALGSTFVFRLAFAKKTIANTPTRNSTAPAAFSTAVTLRKNPPGF